MKVLFLVAVLLAGGIVLYFTGGSEEKGRGYYLAVPEKMLEETDGGGS